MNKFIVTVVILFGITKANAGAWTEPVEVRQEENLCLTYQAKLEGSMLVVRATIEPAWHTFAMDIKKRAEEKLAGRASLGIERGTLKPEADADVTIIDRSTYEAGRTLADGVDHVLVNGTLVLEDGEPTGETPGRALRRS